MVPHRRLLLGDIDHIATVRQARGMLSDPLQAAIEAEPLVLMALHYICEKIVGIFRSRRFTY